jgi:hypothetical protein
VSNHSDLSCGESNCISRNCMLDASGSNFSDGFTALCSKKPIARCPPSVISLARYEKSWVPCICVSSSSVLGSDLSLTGPGALLGPGTGCSLDRGRVQ